MLELVSNDHMMQVLMLQLGDYGQKKLLVQLRPSLKHEFRVFQ